jgi:hypothetical protein
MARDLTADEQGTVDAAAEAINAAIAALELKHVHDWGDWVVTLPATYDTAGEETRVCKDDPSHTETKPIPALVHNYDAVYTNPTCEDDGYWTYTCADCGDIYTVPDTGTKLGHSWDAGVVTIAPTYTAEGVKTFTCLICSDTRTEPIPKLTASLNEITVTPPTKTVYSEGDVLDLAGMTVTASYNDGTTVTLAAADYTTAPAGGAALNTIGTRTVTVSYTDGGITRYATFTVTVNAAITYEFTINNAGPNTTGDGRYPAGATVTISAGIRQGYTFQGWFHGEGVALANASSTTTTFVMPAQDAHVTINWVVSSGGGGGGGGGGAYTPPPVTPPVVTVIEETKTPLGAMLFTGNPFEDVLPTDWFHDVVLFIAGHGLMDATSTSPMLFSPYMNVTRGMVVTAMYRLAGSPDVSELENPFKDVSEKDACFNAVKWAAKNKVVAGYGNGLYGPNDDVTREQLAAIIVNYQVFAKLAPAYISEEIKFDDWDKVGDWAKEVVRRLTRQSIIFGKPGNLYDPKSSATRAEYAAILYRYIAAIYPDAVKPAAEAEAK